MGSDIIRVGIVGANPQQGWASTAHVPALTQLPNFAITAVCTTRPESARMAATAFGAAHAFTDARQLASHPEVDLVTVAVRTPAHLDPVLAALEAGKHVYCEWPLARTTKEAEMMASAARDAGVTHAVGLQARYAPAVAYLRDLIAEGYIGQVTSVDVIAARGKLADGQIAPSAVYTLDVDNGASTLEVAGGHTLDLLQHLVGEITDVTATLARRRLRYTVTGTDSTVEATAPDHVLLSATLADGAVASVHVYDGKVGTPRTHIEINGTRGDLLLTSAGPGGPRGVQLGDLVLRAARVPGGDWETLEVPDRYRTVAAPIPVTAILSVAQLYHQLGEDIRTGERRVPDLETGLRVHRLLDAIRLSADTGTRQAVR